jgi:putative endonuclease
MRSYNFHVYITTNPVKTTLYVGVTNDLSRRLYGHAENKGNPGTYAGKYYCYNLVYFEHFTHITYAILREKKLKNGAEKRRTH